MTRKGLVFCGATLLAVVLLASPAAAQTVAQTSGEPSAKPTAPPPNWMEQWVGMYGSVDHAGKNPPPGFEILVPLEQEDEVAMAHSQPWAIARREATDYELEDLAQMCKPSGIFRAYNVAAFELLVSPEKITMIGMAGGGIHTSGIRRIYMNRPHPPNPPLTFFGDSVGHWEGDTLVIDTIGFNDNTWLGQDRSRHSNALHIVERMRFVLNGEYLEHIYIVDDPYALTSPYTMSRYHKKLASSTPIGERLCEDSPEARRAWAKLFNRSKKEWEERRKTIGAPSEAKDGQR